MRVLIGSLIRITEIDPRSAFYGQRDVVVGMLCYYRGMLRKYPKFARFKFRVIGIRAHPLCLEMHRDKFTSERSKKLQLGTTIAATYEVVGGRREPCLPS